MPAVPQDVHNDYLNNLQAITKTKFDDGGIHYLYPEDTQLMNLLGPGIDKAKRVGKNFEWPVKLSFSQGHTYAAAGAGAFPHRPSRPGQTLTAQVNSTNHVHRATIDYETIWRTDDDKVPDGAYANAVDELFVDLRTGTVTRIEESFWYAGTNLGQIQSAATPAGGEMVLTIKYDFWAPLLFIGKESAPYDIFLLDADGLRPTGNPLNVNATYTFQTGTTTNAPVVLESVNIEERKLTISGNATDLTAIKTAVDNAANKVALVYWGQKGNDTRGLDDIITNTGMLYGIPSSDHSLWRGNSSSNEDEELTLRWVYRHIGPSVDKGLNIQGMNGKGGLDFWLNPTALRDLIANETALRRHVQEGGGTATNGYMEIRYDSEVGPITFRGYGRVKRSEGFILPTKKVIKKLGAKEPGLWNFDETGKTGQMENGTQQADNRRFLRSLEGQSACEAQMVANIGCFVTRPSWCTKVTNIRPQAYTG